MGWSPLVCVAVWSGVACLLVIVVVRYVSFAFVDSCLSWLVIGGCRWSVVVIVCSGW